MAVHGSEKSLCEHLYDEQDDANSGVQGESKKKEKQRASVVIDTLNKAARTILDHQKEFVKWTAVDYSEDALLFEKITGSSHYISEGAKNDYLRKIWSVQFNVALLKPMSFYSYCFIHSKYLVKKAPCSPHQGAELAQIITRMFKKRGETKSQDTVKLDPIRQSWKKFLRDLCLNEERGAVQPADTETY